MRLQVVIPERQRRAAECELDRLSIVEVASRDNGLGGRTVPEGRLRQVSECVGSWILSVLSLEWAAVARPPFLLVTEHPSNAGPENLSTG